ncbi:MAG: SDR family oxidoreductase [Bdellovibrionia bacterium]
MSESIAVLGASRGLGAAFVKAASREISDSKWLLASRKENRLKEVAGTLADRAHIFPCDFAAPESRGRLLDEMKTFAPTRVFYFAAGGPYGPFHKSALKDHRWAWEVSFGFAAEVLHWSLNSGSVRQAVFIGSAVAEDQADPGAASYSAAKHALRGLIRSVRAEKPALDLRLYSPVYMDTELLPAHAWPRQQGLAMDTSRIAQDLLSWIFINDDSGFRIYK